MLFNVTNHNELRNIINVNLKHKTSAQKLSHGKLVLFNVVISYVSMVTKYLYAYVYIPL